ncbi:hypothetical protein EIN_152910 [Entamoeba invadens IP1]|uniref:CCZ1/INTU/HSP4 first Longin domain-containing protein n=1 Tax=Entamoeba invadens IP1 TaxID=370355 RepID=A0A0A1U8R4_ENTIV|nr:hypothetical protein EIN_152910 [Entamoeba invadens IP1]ELP91294.1 hypothetical protein EIN_152910 [Entamoeba invadens IP1]|eukprot:XP_004258065.1 hypothetical protein EIN_152910 [Entamoeba invadens IP1]
MEFPWKIRYFAVVDLDKVVEEGHQDERILYTFRKIEETAVVVSLNHIVSYISIIKNFKSNVSTIRTKWVTTYVSYVTPSISYILQLEQVNKSFDIHVLKYLKFIEESYSLTYGYMYNKVEAKITLGIFFQIVFQSFKINDIFYSLYSIKSCVAAQNSFLFLSSKMNVLREKYSTFKTCFIANEKSILFTEMPSQHQLKFFQLTRGYTQHTSSLSSLMLNRWLFSKKHCPLYMEANANAPDIFIDTFISSHPLSKTSKERIVFLLIFKSEKQVDNNFYKDFNIKQIVGMVHSSRSSIVFTPSINSLKSTFLNFDGNLFVSDFQCKIFEELFLQTMRNIEFTYTFKNCQTLLMIFESHIVVVRKTKRNLTLQRFVLDNMEQIETAMTSFENLLLTSFV